ncbi:MAG: hypothetical protein ACE5G6_00365 [Terriglobia bacterium]
MASQPKEDRAILEALRRGKAPSIVKRQASRGTIPVAAEELLEILVFLTKDPDPTCSDVARQTLAAWPLEKCASLLPDPEVSGEALAYFASQPDVPDSLVTIIAGHPNAGDDALAPLAGRLSLEQIQQIAANDARLEALPQFVAALLPRTDLPADLRSRLESFHGQQARQQEELAAALARQEEAEAQAKPEEKRERESLTQKISKMSVSERMQLALKGSRDERLILIRDPSKVVYRAVLQSPKLTDSEVESFASMKNVADEALRIIASTRKLMKSYVVVRNLVNNPRTPLDISLGLLNRLTEKDLKFLTKNRNVPETVCSTARRLHQQRTSTRGGSSH